MSAFEEGRAQTGGVLDFLTAIEDAGFSVQRSGPRVSFVVRRPTPNATLEFFTGWMGTLYPRLVTMLRETGEEAPPHA